MIVNKNGGFFMKFEVEASERLKFTLPYLYEKYVIIEN